MSVARRVAALLGYDLRSIRKSDAMEWHLRRFFAHHAIDHVIDCGAFIGKFGAACRNASYRGPIHSFEPSRQQYAKLAAAAAGDPGWTAINAGLSDTAGQAAIRVSSGAGDLNSLYAHRSDMSGRFAGLDEASTETITLMRLDEFLVRDGIGPTKSVLLKSDTQGHDLCVLRGAGDRLAQVRGVLLEMSVQPLYQGTPSHWDVLDFLRRAGFEPYGFSSLSRDDESHLIEYDALFVRR